MKNEQHLVFLNPTIGTSCDTVTLSPNQINIIHGGTWTLWGSLWSEIPAISKLLKHKFKRVYCRTFWVVFIVHNTSYTKQLKSEVTSNFRKIIQCIQEYNDTRILQLDRCKFHCSNKDRSNTRLWLKNKEHWFSNNDKLLLLSDNSMGPWWHSHTVFFLAIW